MEQENPRDEGEVDESGSSGPLGSLFGNRTDDTSELVPPPFPDEVTETLVPPTIPDPFSGTPASPTAEREPTVPIESPSPFADSRSSPHSLIEPPDLTPSLGTASTSTGLPAPGSESPTGLTEPSWSSAPTDFPDAPEEPLNLDSLLGPSHVDETAEETVVTPPPLPKRRTESQPIIAVLGGILGLAVLGAAWYFATDAPDPLISEREIASPADTWDRFLDLVDDGTLVDDVVSTLTSLALALVVGGAAGLAVGAAGGSFPVVRAVLRPFLAVFRVLSPVLVMAVLIARWGLEDQVFWIPAALGVFAITAWTTTAAYADEIRGATANMGERVVIGIRTALPIAWALIYAGELLDSDEGIGGTVFRSVLEGDVDSATRTVYLVVAAFLAVLLDGILRVIQRATQN